jgi:hypothetical protein
MTPVIATDCPASGALKISAVFENGVDRGDRGIGQGRKQAFGPARRHVRVRVQEHDRPLPVLRRRETAIDGADEPHVLGQRHECRPPLPRRHPSGKQRGDLAIGGGVVHEDHAPVTGGVPRHPVQRLAQQGDPVVNRHDDREGTDGTVAFRSRTRPEPAGVEARRERPRGQPEARLDLPLPRVVGANSVGKQRGSARIMSRQKARRIRRRARGALGSAGCEMVTCRAAPEGSSVAMRSGYA